MATFNGLDLGAVAVPLVVPNPRRRQVNSYAGVNGQEWLDLGSDGGVIDVETLLYAETPEDLNVLESAWYGYQFGGGAYAFVDNYGNQVPNVVLEIYQPAEAVITMADGGVGRRARLRFIFPG